MWTVHIAQLQTVAAQSTKIESIILFQNDATLTIDLFGSTKTFGVLLIQVLEITGQIIKLLANGSNDNIKRIIGESVLSSIEEKSAFSGLNQLPCLFSAGE